MRRFKDIYSATELSSLLGLLPDININIEYTNNDLCNLDDRSHNVLVSKDRMTNWMRLDC